MNREVEIRKDVDMALLSRALARGLAQVGFVYSRVELLCLLPSSQSIIRTFSYSESHILSMS